MNERKRRREPTRSPGRRSGLIRAPGASHSVPIAAFRSFVTVVETGGFAPASRELKLAVSTVSKHVETLETRLKSQPVAANDPPGNADGRRHQPIQAMQDHSRSAR